MRARVLVVVICAAVLSMAGVQHGNSKKGVECPAGRTCFSGPISIMEPGYYLLTSDLEVPTGNGISVGANDVTVDLNGRTISGLDGVSVGVAIAQSLSGITIRNGRIRGFRRGVTASGDDGVTIEALELVKTIGAGLLLEDMDGVEIRSCRLFQVENGSGPGASGGDYLGGIYLTLRAGSANSRIVDNIVRGDALVTGIYLTGLEGGEFSGNLVSGFGYNSSANGKGVIIASANGSRIVRNEVRYCGAGLLLLHSNGNMVADNVVHFIEESAFTVNGDDNLIERNIVSWSGDSNDGPCGLGVGGNDNQIRDNQVSHIRGDGICLGGARILLDGNLSQGNSGSTPYGCGISFADPNDHVYRNNTLRGNTGGGVCGASNTDAGGNVL